MRRTWLASICALVFSLAMAASARAADQVIWYPQQTATSSGLNQQARNLRRWLGTWVMQTLGLTTTGSGTYSNLTATAATGLFVTIAPTTANSIGFVTQVEQSDPNPLPSTCPGSISCSSQLAADTTLIAPVAFQTSATNPIGPLSAPGTSGQAVYWLIEAQLGTSDVSNRSQGFVIPQGPTTAYVPQMYPVATNRTDTITYQTKAGTAATGDCSSVFPAKPSVDSGWIGIVDVCIPFGASSITGSWISPLTPFAGFIGSNAPAIAILGSIIAGSSTAPTVTAGDLAASRSTTTGAIYLGGSSSSCRTDYGVSLSGLDTIGCALTVNGALGVDSNAAPAHGIAGGSGSQPFNFTSDASSAANTAFLLNNPICSGSNTDVTQYLNNGTLESYIGCDGSYTAEVGGGNTVELGGTEALYALNGNVETIDGALIASGYSVGPTPIIAGGIYTATGDGNHGSLYFGSTSLPGHQCAVQWANPTLTAGCSFQAGTTGPTLSAGDIGASEGVSSGVLYLGGSTTADKIDFGVTTSGVETHSQPVAVTGSISASSHNACSASSGWPCETTGTCSLVSASSCSFTKTVPSGAVCVASGNASDTTTGVETWNLSLSSTTLTVKATVSAPQSQTAAANILCQ